tara:strand:- start:416 stop:757 length:342 start_codon:yes stop_codon:yes gene_type:complete
MNYDEEDAHAEWQHIAEVQQWESRTTRDFVDAKQPIQTLYHEAKIVYLIGCAIQKRKSLEEDTLQRLALATQRIATARDACAPAIERCARKIQLLKELKNARKNSWQELSDRR